MRIALKKILKEKDTFPIDGIHLKMLIKNKNRGCFLNISMYLSSRLNVIILAVCNYLYCATRFVKNNKYIDVSHNICT